MNCYQFKGGNGTASRLVEYAGTSYTVGVFLQANFGSRSELTLAASTSARRSPTTTRWRDFDQRPPAPAR